MKYYPGVTIVFPNYNGGNEPLECLESIKKLKYPQKKIEVIVVDNGSSDGSPDVIAKKFPWVKLIKLKKNLGFIQAVNLGLKQVKSPYIFIGNDDLVFFSGSLTTLVQYLKTHRDVGVIGGKIYYKNSPTEVASAGYLLNRLTGHIYSPINSHTVFEPDWIQGCALLTRKTVISKIGLLDERFGLIYFEDTDFCFRIKKTGYKIVYLPQAEFLHGVTTTMNKNLPTKYYEWYKNKVRFVIKHLSFLHILSILSLHFFIFMPYRLFFLRDGRYLPFLKGFLWNIIHIRETLTARYAGSKN